MQATVFVVDDDWADRKSLKLLLDSIDVPCRGFPSTSAFLKDFEPPTHGCLLADVRMPEMSGLELLTELRQRDVRLPVIIMTAFADVDTAVEAFRNGAFDFVEKPFDEQQLSTLVHSALCRDREQWQRKSRAHRIGERLSRLTPRERQVMTLVVKGRLNKQIAGELNLSIRTVEQYRGQIMAKMNADNLANLVSMTFASRQAGQFISADGM
jgi:two-component system response regulator FixJ